MIVTAVSELALTPLTAADADAYYHLVDRNRRHLTQHGDYTELSQATPANIIEQLSNPDDPNAKFGIWLHDTLIGRADLSPRSPGHYVLGYWLGAEFTGHGYATVACQALIAYGRDQLGATDIFSGVTKGNTASERLLARLGFHRLEDRSTFTLFRRYLD